MSPDRDLCSFLVRPRAEDVQVEYLTIVLYFVSIPILFAELMTPDSPLRIWLRPWHFIYELLRWNIIIDGAEIYLFITA